MRISDWSSDVCSSDLFIFPIRRMTNALFMPDWTVTDVFLDDDGAYQISAHHDSPPDFCYICYRDSDLSPIETKRSKYIYAPVTGRFCFVMITCTRSKCAECRREVWETLSGVAPHRL